MAATLLADESPNAHRAYRDRIEELEEENRQLREAMCPPHVWPSDWGLTHAEGRLLSALVARPGGLTKNALYIVLYGFDGEAEPKIVDVHICRLRRKLPSDISIETIWGQGWRLPAAGIAALKAIDAPSAPVPAPPSRLPAPSIERRPAVRRRSVAPVAERPTRWQLLTIRDYGTTCRDAAWIARRTGIPLDVVQRELGQEVVSPPIADARRG